MSDKCPACSDLLQTKSSWSSVCKRCGLQVSTLAPGPGKAFDGIETLRKKNFELILNAIEPIRSLNGLRLLEVGVAKGWFLEAARRRGAFVSGVEPVSEDVLVARGSGFDVEQGLFPDSPTDRGPYDIIIFNDVFEHLPSPVEAIKASEELLVSGGLLIVNVPSSDGVMFKVAEILGRFGISGPLDRMWQRGLPSPHVTYFNPFNLNLLVEKNTRMRRLLSKPLPSLDRNGLRARINSSPTGIAPTITYCGAWVLSFSSPLLPADIELSVFVK